MYRPLGVVFMGLGITEVDQEGIAEVLRNIAVKALDHGGTDSLVRPYDVAQLLGVELSRQSCRAYEVTEQHGELAPFGGSRGRISPWRCALGTLGLPAKRAAALSVS